MIKLSNRVGFVAMLCLILTVLSAPISTLHADPCGMVPPIYTGEGSPITRIGLQKTFVFYKDGVETFVIRPGFSGKVDQFGMLIPFPSVPAIRKVPDDIFTHVANAIDPPEVVINLRQFFGKNGALRGGFANDRFDSLAAYAQPDPNSVRVVKKEAVGMYEVAVLEAGSAKALKRWLDEHGYSYPDGMDKVTNEYVDLGWCFVAVKTKVSEKEGVDPKPGQRKTDGDLKPGSTFDGFVQAMGFRFETDQLVVPMRLSAFNDGDLRNIVYLMTDGPRRIRNIPEEYVVRQISGSQLLANLTRPLPLRIIGGSAKDLQESHRQGLAARRDPETKNGLAKLLFASDLAAVKSGSLSLGHEEDEKQLLQIGEFFGLRGKGIDDMHAASLAEKAKQETQELLKDVEEMTLTVVDGDFPRSVLAGQNLSFAEYKMPGKLNHSSIYDAKLFGPGQPQDGILIQTGLNFENDETRTVSIASSSTSGYIWLVCSMLAVSVCLVSTLFWMRRR